MIRTTAGFKQRVVFGLLSATLVTAACSDDEDAPVDGRAGQSGSNGVAGKSNNGGNSASGSSSGGVAAAGKSNGGQSAVAGTGGSTTDGGTAGSAGTAGSSSGGGAGGIGGEGNGGESPGGQGGASEPGGGGEGGASIGTAGAGGEAPVFVADVLDNPGFETGTANSSTFPGWTNEGSANAAFIAYSDPHTGFGRLGHWTMWVDAQSPAYTARTYQTLDPIANGTYSFSIWVDRGWFDTQYLFAKGFNAADPDQEVTKVTTEAEAPSGYVKVTLSGIVVTSGHCTVGVYSAAPAGTYTNFDDAEFTLE